MTNTSVDDLSPDEIDYLVARIEKISYMRNSDGSVLGLGEERKIFVRARRDATMYRFSPTSDWRIAGQIIQREGISLQKLDSVWVADIGREVSASDPQPLVAAMRALVIAHYGRNPQLD